MPGVTLHAKAGPAQEFGQVRVDSGPVVIPELASRSSAAKPGRPHLIPRSDQDDIAHDHLHGRDLASAPSRRTRAVAFISDFRAFMALPALPSCRRPTTAFSTVSNNSKTAVLYSLTSRDTTAAATRMICI